MLQLQKFHKEKYRGKIVKSLWQTFLIFKGIMHEKSMVFYHIRLCFRPKQWTGNGFYIISILQKNRFSEISHRGVFQLAVRTALMLLYTYYLVGPVLHVRVQ